MKGSAMAVGSDAAVLDDSERAMNNSGIIIESASESDSEDDNDTVVKIPSSTVVIPAAVETAAFGTVSVANSSEVHFGNKTIFNGPVTIKQLVAPAGFENNGFVRSDDISDQNLHPPGVKHDTGIKQYYAGKLWLRRHFIVLVVFCLFVTATVATMLAILLERSQNGDTAPPSGEDIEHRSISGEDRSGCVDSSYVIVLSALWGGVVSVCVWLVLTITNHDSPTPSSDYNAKAELLPNSRLRYVTRNEWIAQPVEKPLDDLELPVPMVIIAHTATSNCSTQSDCVYIVRIMQTFHIESRKWYDIGYNFLVGGDGSAYVGRGWNKEGAHTLHYNRRSIGIAFIGTFNSVAPPRRQLEACRMLIEDGIALGKIDKDYKLFGHRQLMSTESPGNKLYNIIAQWPHHAKNNSDTEDEP